MVDAEQEARASHFPAPGVARCRCSLPGLTGFTGGRRGVTGADRRRLSPYKVADTIHWPGQAKFDVGQAASPDYL